MGSLTALDSAAFDADFDYDALVNEVRTTGELVRTIDPNNGLARAAVPAILEKRNAGLSRETLDVVRDAVYSFTAAQMKYGAGASREGAIYVGGAVAAASRIDKILDWLSGDSQE